MQDSQQQVSENRAEIQLRNMILAYRELDKKRKFNMIKEQFQEDLIDQEDELEKNQESNEINPDKIKNLKIE